MSTRSKSFWSTMPGLITGLAGILTALVGLGTLLIQIGVIGGDDGDSATTTARPGATATTRAGGAQSDGSDDSDRSDTATGPAAFTVAPDEVKLTSGDKTENLIVSNTGGRAFTVSTEFAGTGKDQFTLSKGTCGSQVPRGGSCTMTLTFKGGLAAEAELVVTASGASSQKVDLEGSLL